MPRWSSRASTSNTTPPTTTSASTSSWTGRTGSRCACSILRARLVFDVRGRGPYEELGLTELFFEGAEPSLFEVPLDELLARFPEGIYEFEGVTVDGTAIAGDGKLSHAVPAGPEVSVETAGDSRRIRWTRVNTVAIDPAGGEFPHRPINVVGYQVIVGSFQVTLPGSATSIVIPPEYFASLKRGTHGFEVLAIDASGNQTITSGVFSK